MAFPYSRTIAPGKVNSVDRAVCSAVLFKRQLQNTYGTGKKLAVFFIDGLPAIGTSIATKSAVVKE